MHINIAQHETLIYFYYDQNGKKDGIKYYIPNLKTIFKLSINGDVLILKEIMLFQVPNLILSIGKQIQGLM